MYIRVATILANNLFSHHASPEFIENSIWILNKLALFLSFELHNRGSYLCGLLDFHSYSNTIFLFLIHFPLETFLLLLVLQILRYECLFILDFPSLLSAWTLCTNDNTKKNAD